jgi:hypothetical protein
VRIVSVAARALLLVVLGALEVGAQEVRGRIIATETREPLTGVFVMLRDSLGLRWAGALTDSTGFYRLRTIHPGTYTVEAERLGYETSKAGPFVVHPTAVLVEDIALAIKPITLPSVSARSGNACDIPRSRAARVAQLWGEARKGLNVASWAASEQLVQYELVRYSRELERDRRSNAREYVEERVMRIAGSPWTTTTAEDMLTHGFQREVSGLTEYHAPHADVLLAPAFASAFCFDLVDSDRDRTRIGLSFRPVDKPSVASVEGTIWLNRTTLALQTIDYDYIRFIRGRRNYTGAGGTVDFAYLSSGLWVMAGWHASFRIRSNSGEIVTVQDGSQVMRALVDQQVIWSAPAHRQLDRSNAASQNDTSYLSSTGVNALPLLSAAAIAAHRCNRGDKARKSSVELVGFIADTTGRPIAGTPLRVVWAADPTVVSRDARSDKNGIYAFCGLPFDKEVILSIAPAGLRPQTIPLHTKRGVILTRSFFLK